MGDIQLGVIRESARIRDEAGLNQVLVRIGDDPEKRIQQKPRQGEPGLRQWGRRSRASSGGSRGRSDAALVEHRSNTARSRT